jgi:hypothetical protein
MKIYRTAVMVYLLWTAVASAQVRTRREPAVPADAASVDAIVAGSDVDSFAEKFKSGAEARKEKGEAAGFFEREIARRTDCFGNVCQIFSTYESRHAASDPKPFERGVNSIQLVRDGKRWWIASVAWEAERPDNPIPPEYLPAAKP